MKDPYHQHQPQRPMVSVSRWPLKLERPINVSTISLLLVLVVDVYRNYTLLSLLIRKIDCFICILHIFISRFDNKFTFATSQKNIKGFHISNIMETNTKCDGFDCTLPARLA